MKKTFLPPSRFNLPLSVRLLLLFAVLTLRVLKVPAQTVTQAGAPKIEIVPVSQREITDHYLNKKFTDHGFQLEVFDGTKESVLKFGEKVSICIAPNQRYFTVAKPLPGNGNETVAYDVELRNLANSILAKGQIPALQSEEADDEFIPADDGSGFIQRAFYISGGLHFVVFQRQEDQLVQRVEINKSEFVNGRLYYEPTQKMIVASFERQTATPGDAKTFVQCFSPDGMLQWENTIDGQYVKSDPFISKSDGTVAFVSRDLRDDSHKNLFFFGKNGSKLRQLSVYRGGLYKRSYYQQSDGLQYFLSPSDGEFYYVIDPASGKIINRQTQGKEGSYVTGLAMFQQYIVTSYFAGNYRPGPDNTQEFAITEHGLDLEDAHGAVTHVPLHLTGEPFLMATEFGLFLREKLGLGVNETNKFYKINIK